jgi:hypothetical protein
MIARVRARRPTPSQTWLQEIGVRRRRSMYPQRDTIRRHREQATRLPGSRRARRKTPTAAARTAT